MFYQLIYNCEWIRNVELEDDHKEQEEEDDEA